MTWLHITAPLLALAALYTGHRGGLCLGCFATLVNKTDIERLTKTERQRAFGLLVEGYGYALLTVALALAAGFIAGRIL